MKTPKLLALWLVCGLALAAQVISYTPILNLAQPPAGMQNWAYYVNQNWLLIDQKLGPLTNPFLGAWSSTTTYSSGVYVTYSGSLYFSIQPNNLNQVPSSSPTYWYNVGSSGVVFPASGNLMVSTGPSGNPSGIPEVDGNCAKGVSGAWASGACGGGTPASPSGAFQVNFGGSFGASIALYYAQAGDTLTSIQALCGSNKILYVVDQPQTITLSGNTTVNSCVALTFTGHGEWTVNGSGDTLTIPGMVTSESMTQHFAGTASILFGPNTPTSYAEWFGAVGDGTTSDCTAIQNAINSVRGSTSIQLQTGTGNVQLLAKTYLCNSTISIQNGGIGLFGINNGSNNPPFVTSLLATSPGTTQLSIQGAAGESNWLEGNTVRYITLVRGTQDNSSGVGLNVQNTFRTVVEDVGIYDSTKGVYLANVGSGGIGRFANIQVYQDATSNSANNYYGFYVDSSSGQSTPSLRLQNDTVGAYTTGFTHYYGLYATGDDIQDLHVTHLETSEVGYGIYLNSTSSGGLQNGDNHFWQSILDGCQVSCIVTTGLTTAGGSSAEFNGGNIENDGSSPTIDLEGVNGVTLSNLQIVPNPVHSVTSSLIKINGGGANTVNGNHLLFEIGSTTGILITSSSGNVIADNTLQGFNDTDTGVSLTGSSYNVISGNALSGAMATGLSLDSSSNNNTSATVNSINPASITTPLSDSGSGNQLSGGGGGGLNGTVTYTSSQTAASGDNGKLVIMNCPSSCSYTLPATQPSTTWSAAIMSKGASLASIVLGGSDTFNGSTSVPVLNKYKAMWVFANSTTSTDYGGDAPIVAGSGVTFSAATNGLTVAATGGGGGDFAQLAQVVVSGGALPNTVTFSSIPNTYTNLKVEISAQTNDSGVQANLGCQINGDTTAAYDMGYVQGGHIVAGNGNVIASTSGQCGVAQTINAYLANASAAPTVIEIPGYANTTFWKMFLARSGYSQTTTEGEINAINFIVTHRSSTAISSFTIIDSGGGGFENGSTFTLYGEK